MTEVAKQHTDQAQTLRQLNDDKTAVGKMTAGGNKEAQVYAVTSGKGGVGKTAVVSNLAVSLGRAGKKVLIIDADLGLANIDVVFGLAPQYNINHFFQGERSLTEIVTQGPEGVFILPAGSGVQQFTQLDSGLRSRLLADLEQLPQDFDVVLIDTEAGISNNVTYFNRAARDILVVTTPEPTAITDAYSLMKLLSSDYEERRFNLVVNSVRNSQEALEVYRKLTMVSNRYLDISIDYLGGIPYDRRMSDAVRRQQVMVDLFPQTKTSDAFTNLAQVLTSDLRQQVQPKGAFKGFWQRLLSMAGGS